MKYHLSFVTFFIIVFFYPFNCIHADNIDSLRRVAEKTGKAADWNRVAVYYDEEVIDTALLRFYAQNAYRMAIAENDTDEQGTALLRISSYYEYMGDLTTAMEKAKQALDCFRKRGDMDLMGDAFNFIAYFHNETGQYDDAIEIYHQLIDLGKKTKDPDAKRNMAQCYGNISFAYTQKGIPDSVMLYNRRRLDLAYEIKDTTLIIDALTDFAILNAKKHDYREALIHYEEALKLSQLNKKMLDAIHLYMNIATLYMEWGKNEQALEFALKSEQMASEYGGQLTYARMLSLSGSLHARSGLYYEAIEKAMKSLPVVQNSPFYNVKCLETLAMSYSELGKTDSSGFYLSKIEAYIDAGHAVDLSRFYSTKGVILFQQEKYQEAVHVLEKAVELQQTTDKHTQKESVKLYQLLSEAWQKGYRNYEKALHYKQLQLNLSDSMFRKEHSEAMADFNVKYLSAEKELEIAHLKLQREELLRTRSLIITGLVILATLLLVAWLYVLFLRWKRKAEMEKKSLQSYLEGLESERSRLAKEIHDHVSNGMLALENKMQSAGVPSELTDMANILQKQVREISHALIPPVFQYASLPEIIDDYVREQNRMEGPCFQFYLTPEEGWEELSPQTALDLYRIVQEASSNAIKYADAKNIAISLSRKGNQKELSITDDGCGFDIASVSKGIGLQTIHERAANQNGTVSVEASPGKGTVIQLRIKN